VADIERSAQEVAFIGRRKRNPCVEMGSSLVAVQTGDSGARIMVGIGSTEVAAWLAVKGCTKARRIRIQRPDSLQVTRSKVWRRNPPGPRRQQGERPHAGGNAQPVSFGADKVMRAQAIVATMIAPAIAMTSRQPSMGTTTSASPCAA
jgi:hypothetical protein